MGYPTDCKATIVGTMATLYLLMTSSDGFVSYCFKCF